MQRVDYEREIRRIERQSKDSANTEPSSVIHCEKELWFFLIEIDDKGQDTGNEAEAGSASLTAPHPIDVQCKKSEFAGE